MARIDVVVVSYNSAPHVRACVEPLSSLDGIDVVVVDNASVDASLATIADLPVQTIARRENGGFAVACNEGWQAGSAAYVLFLNPDATIDEASLQALAAVLERRSDVGAVAPRIEHPDGSLAHSLRRFPTVRSTFAQALFLHRVFPHASWSGELIVDPQAYERPCSPEWASGACLLVRRSALVELGGWDEGFFLYGEDVDLCRRLHDAGYEIRFEPAARVVHHEGASSSRARALPRLAEARVRYADTHATRPAAILERLGVALWGLTHAVVSRGGPADRVGHLRSLARALSPHERARRR